MKSLFNASDNEAIIKRIHQLSGNSLALWGKMNATQMLAHLSQPMKVSFGELRLKRGLMGILLVPLQKNKW